MIKRIIKFSFVSIGISILILLFIEITVRLLFPNIKCWHTKKEYLADNIFNSSYSFKKNIKGIICEKAFFSDEFGFRTSHSLKLAKEKKSAILLLGDSVPFGIGVEADNTSPFLLEKRLKNYRIINASIPGYWIEDYLNVFEHLLDKVQFEVVIICISLNDFDNISQSYIKEYLSEQSKSETVLSNPLKRFLININNQFFDFNHFLMQFSKFYLLLRNIIFDTSKTYFLADRTYYQDSKSKKTINFWLSKINETAKKNNKKILFFILPYEYQLRQQCGDKEVLKPQEIINEIALENSLPIIDLAPILMKIINDTNIKSTDLFLTFDPQHLSEKGHFIISEILLSELERNRMN